MSVKLFGNFGHLFANGLQAYAALNRIDTAVTAFDPALLNPGGSTTDGEAWIDHNRAVPRDGQR